MKLIVISALSLTMTACASFDVKEADRTSSPDYDGVWVGVFNKTEPVQTYYGSYDDSFQIFNCEDIKGGVKAKVSAGSITGTIGFAEPIDFTSNISDSGRIYFELPKQSTFVSTINGIYREVPFEGAKELSVSRNSVQEYHVLEGSLDASGEVSELTYTAAYGMRHGCKYSLPLKRA